MSLRKFGLAVAITTLSVLSIASTDALASHRRSGHHGQHGHQGHHAHQGVKKCFHTSEGFRCYHLKSR